MSQASRRTQLLALLYSMKQQGKESATFNIDFLIEACQESITVVHETAKEGVENTPQEGDMDGGGF
ncbi:hypothetical protein N9I83_00350 [bacterium]|nr:hypothetical protein [bacterium]